MKKTFFIEDAPPGASERLPYLKQNRETRDLFAESPGSLV
jgi:hypothetical protein